MRPTGRLLGPLLAAAALLAIAPVAAGPGGGPAGGALHAQDAGSIEQQIRDSQLRLEQIREERRRLQQEINQARVAAEDVSQELRNIERQISAQRSVLAELDFQTEFTAVRVEDTQRELLLTRERLRAGSATLNRRLRDIYKLGPLHTVRVLLGAESIADLMTRYRYLRLMAGYDRTLVDQVRRLESALTAQSDELQQSLRELGQLRQQKLGEVAELRSVEQDRQATLTRYRREEATVASRLDQLEADIARLTGLVDDLERRRLEAERRAAVAGRSTAAATMADADAGSLDWPVDGELIYRFGRERRPDGLVLRWNGIGIAAPVGTPVRAVRDGTVVLAGPFEGYGPTVVVSHGEGFYTLYLYLEEIGVVEGRAVSAGQVVGTVGGEETPEGPHVEFQIRAPVQGGSPQARDPLQWLRPRGGR